MWDSARRAAKRALGPADGSRGMIDALHHAAHLGRTRTIETVKELLDREGLTTDPAFSAALAAMLEVLPVSQAYTAVALEGSMRVPAATSRRSTSCDSLAFAERVPASHET